MEEPNPDFSAEKEEKQQKQVSEKIKKYVERIDKGEVTKIKISLAESKVRIRKNERRNTLKIHINLSKEESESVQNFIKILKPDGISDEEMIKSIFMAGVVNLQEKVDADIKKWKEENPEEVQEPLEKVREEGIEIPEDFVEVSSLNLSSVEVK